MSVTEADNDRAGEDSRPRTPTPDEGAPSICSRARSVAVGWLVEVASQLRLHDGTLFLAVGLLDRFSRSLPQPLPLEHLQMACCSCLLLAAKHEEEFHPSTRDLVAISGNAFEAADLVACESAVLDALEWRVRMHTALTFLEELKLEVQLSPRVHDLAHYLLELSLLDADAVAQPPQLVAAAALLLAAQRCMLDAPALLCALQVRSAPGALHGKAVAPCVRLLMALLDQATSLEHGDHPIAAVVEKHAARRAAADAASAGAPRAPSPAPPAP